MTGSPAAVLCGEGRLVAANEPFETLLPHAAQAGSPFARWLPIQPQRDDFQSLLGRMLSERLPYAHIEALVGGPNGDPPLLARLLLSRLQVASGSIGSFLLQCLTDADQLQPAEVDTRLLSMAIRAAGLGIWRYDVHSGTMRFSLSGSRILAPESGEQPLAGPIKKFLDMVHEDYRHLVKGELRRCANAAGGKTSTHIEFPLAGRNPERWCVLRGRGFARHDDEPCDLLAGIIEDVTGAKLTEQALRESDDIFRQLTENVDGVFSGCARTRTTRCFMSAPATKKISGREVTELFSNPESVIESIYPDDLDRVQAATSLDENSDDPFHHQVEYRIVRPGGGIRWVSDHAFSVRGNDGQIHRRAGLLTDVTGRKLAEERLTLLGTALAAAANSVVITDKGGVIRWVNPAFLSVTGYEEHEVLGKPTSKLKSGLHDRAFYESIWETIRRGRVWRGEISNKRKDGTIYQEEMTITPVRGAGGQIEHFIAIKQDITERLATSQALVASERKYRRLFEAAHEAIFLLREGEIIDCNRHAKHLLECTRNLTIGKKLHDLAPIRQPDGKDSEVKSADIARLAADREVSELEWKGKRGNGLLFDGELSASMVRFGSESWVQVIVRDVSERRRMEVRMRQNQKLEAIGQLAGGVAHDSNNLLLVITGHLELMLGSLGLHDRNRPHLEKARTAALHAADLTRQLLAFSRQQVMVYRRLNLSEIVQESPSLLSRLIPPNITIRHRLAPEACFIQADPSQMRQIIMNLIVNAQDAMPDGGTIHVSTQTLEITEPVEIPSNIERLQVGKYVVLTIEDTGHGMDADTLTRIFGPFFTTKSKGRGTGLGLATVFGIVKQTGGDITVESQPGKGTTFTLYFPRVVPESQGDDEVSQAEETASAGVTTSKTGVVFVVEDEGAVRSLVAQILIGAGYKVITAETPGEALRQAESREFCPDLLIVDVVLPEMSGPELAQKLQEHRPTLKVLYTSGYSEIGEMGPGCSLSRNPTDQPHSSAK